MMNCLVMASQKNNAYAEMTKCLAEHGGKIGDDAVENAAGEGHIEIVKFLVEHGGKIGNGAVFKAAINGHIEVVKFLVDKDGKIGAYAVEVAARNGHIEVVKFLVDKDAKIGAYAVEDAARNGHVEVVKFLVDKGGEIEAYAVEYAARNGHIEIVKFLVDKGGEIGVYAVEGAARNGHIEIAKFLVEKGAGIKVILWNMKKSIRDGNFEEVSKLRALGVDLKQLVDKKSNIFESTLKSMMSPSDSIEQVNVKDVDTENFTVAQNFCDTLVRMKDGSILKLRNTKAEDAYWYFKQATGNNTVQSAPEKLNKFIEFVNPGHGFMGVDKGSIIESFGFYPKSDTDSEDIISGDYKTEAAVGATLFIGSFLTMFTVINSMAAVANKCGFNYGIQTLAPVLLSTITTFLGYKKAEEYIPHIDHKLGRVTNEEGEIHSSDNGNHLKISFIMTEEQTEKLERYIETVERSCSDKSPEHCLYHVMTRNCMVFTKDAFQAAGFKGNPFDFFSTEQLANTDFGSFKELYNTKALFFAQMTSKGLVMPQDSFVELEDYLHAHPAYHAEL